VFVSTTSVHLNVVPRQLEVYESSTDHVPPDARLVGRRRTDPVDRHVQLLAIHREGGPEHLVDEHRTLLRRCMAVGYEMLDGPAERRDGVSTAAALPPARDENTIQDQTGAWDTAHKKTSLMSDASEHGSYSKQKFL
jgi:hypothetical protein